MARFLTTFGGLCGDVQVMTKWVFQALVDSLVVFFLPLNAYDDPFTVWAKRGYADGLYVFGTTVYSCLIMAMMLKAFNVTMVRPVHTRLWSLSFPLTARPLFSFRFLLSFDSLSRMLGLSDCFSLYWSFSIGASPLAAAADWSSNLTSPRLYLWA